MTGARGPYQTGHTGKRRERCLRPVTWPRVPRCRARIRPLGVAMAKAGRKRRGGGTRGRSPAGCAHVPQARWRSGRWWGAVTGKGRCWRRHWRRYLSGWRWSLLVFHGSRLTCGVPLETVPLSSASHARPPPSLHSSGRLTLPTAPLPRRDSQRGRCWKMHTSARPDTLTKVSPCRNPPELLSALSLLCSARRLKAEAALVVQHLRQSVSPNAVFVSMCLPLHQVTEPKQETLKLLMRFDNHSCQLLCKKCLIFPSSFLPSSIPKLGSDKTLVASVQ